MTHLATIFLRADWIDEMEQPMFLTAFVTAMETAIMTIEASNVIAMRLKVLGQGDAQAEREANLMIAEKIEAFSQAGTDMLTGVSNAVIRSNFRAAIQANEIRLTAMQTAA